MLCLWTAGVDPAALYCCTTFQDSNDAAAYVAQGSSFVRNIGHRAKESFITAKHAMDQGAGPDLSYLFEKPSQLSAKPVLAPQRWIPQVVATQPPKPSIQHKFQRDRQIGRASCRERLCQYV